MENTDIERNIESKLIYIYSIVVDMLKYAEAKNGIILTLSGAGIAAILGFIASATNIYQGWINGLSVCIAFLSISCIFSILSFIPITNNKFTKAKCFHSNTDLNFLFYKNLCKYDESSLIKDICNKYFGFDESKIKLRKPYLDLANQIICNSWITNVKFTFFNISAWLMLLGLLSIFIIAALTAI